MIHRRDSSLTVPSKALYAQARAFTLLLRLVKVVAQMGSQPPVRTTVHQGCRL
jgi:hypothetical protein